MEKIEQHELSSAFPQMTKTELDALTEDISENGQREAITLFQGKVLDGWHRYNACINCGRVPKAEELPAGVDPVAFVKSRNLHRRHLTGSQRAAAVLACAEWAKPGTNQHTRGSAPGAEAPRLTTAELAREAEVSPRTIQHAKVAVAAGKGDAVRDGEISAKEAAETAKQKNAENVPNNGGQAGTVTEICGRGKKAAVANPPQPDGQILIDKAEHEQLLADMASLIADNEAMGKIFDADDRLKTATDQNESLRKTNTMLQQRLDSLMIERNEAVKVANRSKSMIRQLQKQLGQASTAPVTIEVEKSQVDDGGLPD